MQNYRTFIIISILSLLLLFLCKSIFAQALIGTATTNVITVGTTSTTLLNSRISRKYCFIINLGTATDCYYQLAPTATVGSGTPLVKGTSNNTGFGVFESNFSLGIYTGAISAITRTGTTSVLATEY